MSELAIKYNVMPETIRRDLAELEGQKLLIRTYGGAVPYTDSRLEPPFEKKRKHMNTEKAFIGRLEASLIKSGDTIYIDVGRLNYVKRCVM